MVVNLADTYKVRSNRESGFGRYDVMLEPLDKNGKAFLFEFKVLDADEDEVTLEDTLANAHAQIEEKQYEEELISQGFAPEQIRKYGFAFQGKTCPLLSSLQLQISQKTNVSHHKINTVHPKKQQKRNPKI